jgi:hypothetical protein
MAERTCEDYSKIGKVCTGVAYARVQNYFFGDDSIVLVGEGSDGEDLSFAATERWGKANSPGTRFGLSLGGLIKISEHFSGCDYDLCKDVANRFEMVKPYLPGGGKMLGGDSLILISAFHGKMGDSPCLLSRESGAGDSIDELKPFFEWFEERGLWVWPD